MPKLNKTQRKVALTNIGIGIGRFEVDKRLAFTGDTQYHSLSIKELADGLQCQPL